MLRPARFHTIGFLTIAAFAATPALRAQEELVGQPPAESKPAKPDEKKGDATPKSESTTKPDASASTKPDSNQSSKPEPPKDGTASPATTQSGDSRRDERGRRDRPSATANQSIGFGKADKLQLNIEVLEWERVLELLAQRTGRTLNYVGKKPGGDPVSYKDDVERPIADVIDILNLKLIPKGHIIQRNYNFLNVLEYTNNKIPGHYVDRIKVEELDKKAKTEIVRVLFKPNKLIASGLATDFKDFVAPLGEITAITSTNELNIMGTAESVRQVIALITASDGPQGQPPNFQSFPLKFIPAVEAEIVVRGILGMPPRDARPAAPGQQQNPFDRRGRGGQMAVMFGMVPQPQPGQPQPGQQAPPIDPTKGPFVAIDERSNTLFVFATPDKIAVAKEAIDGLDKPTAADGQSQQPKFETYEVEAGAAEGVAAALGSVFEKHGDTRVSPHPGGNHIFVYATPRDHMKVKEIIVKMRSEAKRFEGIQLRELDALDQATILRRLFGQEKDDGNQRMRRMWFFGDGGDEKKAVGPQIAADSANNRLLVYGTESQIQHVKELLIQCGETSLAVGADRGRTRVIQFGDADTRELEARIVEVWSRVGNKTPIKVEVLGKQGEPKQPNAEKSSAPQKQKENGGVDRKTSLRTPAGSEVRFASFQEAVPAESQQPPANTAGDRPPTSQGSPPQALPDVKGVTVIVGRGTIMIQSDDPVALDAAEKMMRMLVQGPKGAGVVVYKLKSADAFDMAMTLDDLLNPPRSSGFDFFGSQETDEERAQRPRIVSDTRTNSLIVIGPQAAQLKVQQMLQILDVESPETDVTAQARPIQIKYKSAESVAQQLRDTFAPDVYQQQGAQPQQGQQPGQDNGMGRFGMFGPFGMSMGGGGGRSGRGGRGSGGQGGDPKGKIVITADDVSNTVWVRAPKPRFDEIEEVAHRLDNAAANAKQAVRVLTLRHTKTDTMQKMLNQVFGVETSAAKEGQEGGPGGQNQNQGMGRFGDPRFGGGDRDRGGDRSRGDDGDRGGGGRRGRDRDR